MHTGFSSKAHQVHWATVPSMFSATLSTRTPTKRQVILHTRSMLTTTSSQQAKVQVSPLTMVPLSLQRPTPFQAPPLVQVSVFVTQRSWHTVTLLAQSQVTTDFGCMANPMSLLKTTPFKTQQKSRFRLANTTTVIKAVTTPDHLQTEPMWPITSSRTTPECATLCGCTVVISFVQQFTCLHLLRPSSTTPLPTMQAMDCESRVQLLTYNAIPLKQASLQPTFLTLTINTDRSMERSAISLKTPGQTPHKSTTSLNLV